MESEALGFRAGELRREDVRIALGDAYFTASELNVFVLGTAGQMSSACTVRLGWAPGGRGQHRVLLCPVCAGPSRVLRTDGRGGLRCRSCDRYRTRHQREKRRRDFRRLGGREADRLQRLLRRASSASPAALSRAGGLVGELVQADHDRLAALMANVDAALWLGKAAADG